MKKIAKKEFFRPVCMVIDLPCKTLLMTSSDPYAGEETIDILLDIPTDPTEVAAIGFDRTGTTRIGKYVLNHSFQLAGFITTFVSIAIAYLLVVIFY